MRSPPFDTEAHPFASRRLHIRARIAERTIITLVALAAKASPLLTALILFPLRVSIE
ncbi:MULTISPECIES: hypothetical protein [unclassified Bradyrhizobium]|uniref:hypothetical protein n=1 Tax=unclassified Bradyrhizobium TaxID=2631580 RepID=UPI002915CF6E|nr:MULTISPECIES: hypothetical protein [unclassified Bradyrhizobium]